VSAKKSPATGDGGAREEMTDPAASKVNSDSSLTRHPVANRAERRRRAAAQRKAAKRSSVHARLFCEQCEGVARITILYGDHGFPWLGLACLICGFEWTSVDQPPAASVLLRPYDASAGMKLDGGMRLQAMMNWPLCAACAGLPNRDDRIVEGIEAVVPGVKEMKGFHPGTKVVQ